MTTSFRPIKNKSDTFLLIMWELSRLILNNFF